MARDYSRAAQHTHNERHRRRLAAVRAHSGALTGAYPSDYLDRLREEWPA